MLSFLQEKNRLPEDIEKLYKISKRHLYSVKFLSKKTHPKECCLLAKPADFRELYQKSFGLGVTLLAPPKGVPP
jgi:hypothetical protein